MRSLTPTMKGLVTGIIMVLVSAIIFYTKGNFQNKLQYITYSIYVAGIVWTLFEYSRQEHTPQKFGTYFSTGFKCFIVVTLMMVIFTGAFLLMQPQLKEEMAEFYKAELVKKGDYTPAEIAERVEMAKKSFFPSMIMAAIFGYLVIGALVTAIASVFLLNRNRALG